MTGEKFLDYNTDVNKGQESLSIVKMHYRYFWTFSLLSHNWIRLQQSSNVLPQQSFLVH